jgi:hypothetical protein
MGTEQAEATLRGGLPWLRYEGAFTYIDNKSVFELPTIAVRRT